MKLYIKQHVFSWGDKFSVFNENGEAEYNVQGEIFSWGKRLHVYDRHDSEVLYIRQKLWAFLPQYHVFVNDTEIGRVVREFSFFTPRYSFDGLGWSVQGDFTGHSYSVTDGNALIAAVQKRWFTWGDTYEIDITHSGDVLYALALVLAIDAAVASQDDN